MAAAVAIYILLQKEVPFKGKISFVSCKLNLLADCLFPGTWSCRICLLDQKTVRLEPGERIQMSRTVDNRLICSASYTVLQSQ